MFEPNEFTASIVRLTRKFVASKKFIVLLGGTTAIVAGLAFMSEPFSRTIERIFWIDVERTSLLLLLISFVSFSMLYLQSGDKKKTENNTVVNNFQTIDSDAIHTKSQIEELNSQIEIINEKLNNINTGAVLTTEEKDNIITSIIAQSGSDAIKSIFSAQSADLTEEIRKTVMQEQLELASSSPIQRLQREIADLRLRSNINLVIGMSVTAGGLYLLWSTVSLIDASEVLKKLASEGDGSNSKFMKILALPLLPRISLVIFIEIFAYFFLRLYRNGLAEIKYFQNELTNIESKLISMKFAYATQNVELIKSSIEALSRTERNFILESGQTTVELERAKADSETTKNLLKHIHLIFRKASK